MKLLNAHAKLLALKQDVICTNDAAACLKITIAHASRLLNRLSKAGFFIPLSRGKWGCRPTINPLILPHYLTSPVPCYISFLTALYYHGMISQIPDTIYAASLARTRQYKTPLARISIHRIEPNFFFGFRVDPHLKIRMATPEKALLDTLYLSATRSRLFGSLPELELPPGFKRKEALKMIDKIPSLRLRSLVRKKLQSFLA